MINGRGRVFDCHFEVSMPNSGLDLKSLSALSISFSIHLL